MRSGLPFFTVVQSAHNQRYRIQVFPITSSDKRNKRLKKNYSEETFIHCHCARWLGQGIYGFDLKGEYGYLPNKVPEMVKERVQDQSSKPAKQAVVTVKGSQGCLPLTALTISIEG